jgi:hypothetical protein
MSQRFFRTADDAVYEQARLGLDAAWDHQPPTTCIDPAIVAPRDADGRIVLAANTEFTEFPAAAAILPDLLASGAVDEIDRDTYMAAVMRMPGE